MEQEKINNDELITIPGFSGPHINKYLPKHSISKGIKKFIKLDQAIQAAKLDKYCSGITRNHKGLYTLRKDKYLLHSHTNNKNLFQEISWLKIFPPNHTIYNISYNIPTTILHTQTTHISLHLSNYHNNNNYNYNNYNYNNNNLYEIIKFKNISFYYNPYTKKSFSLQGNPINTPSFYSPSPSPSSSS